MNTITGKHIFTQGTIKKGVAWLIAGMFSLVELACLAQTPGQLKWSTAIGAASSAKVRGSPAMGLDGTIYFTADDGNLYAINPSTGAVKTGWPVQLNNVHSYEDELTASPVIAPDGTIYVASSDGNLYNIDTSATVKWTLELPQQLRGAANWAGSVAIGSDGTVYVTYDDDDKLYAVTSHGTNGVLKWILDLSKFDYQPFDFYFIDSSPSIGPDCTIYFYISSWTEFSSGDSRTEKLVAVTDNGTLGTIQWSYDLGFGEDADDFRYAPVIGADGTVYVPSDTVDVRNLTARDLVAINPNGSGKWRFSTGGTIKSSTAIGPDGTIYFGSDDHSVYALNPDGTQKWKFSSPGGAVESSPALASDGTLYIGASDNKLYAINSANGSSIWTYSTSGAIESSPLIGSDGTVYFGSDDFSIYAVYGSAGLATSDWPMFRKNPRQTASQSGSTCSSGHCAHVGNPQITDSSFSFDCFGRPNSQFGVFESTDLQNWTLVSTQILDYFGHASFTDDTVTGVTHRFYKMSTGQCCSQVIGFERTVVTANSAAYIADQLDGRMNTLDGLFNPMADGNSLPAGTDIIKYKDGSYFTCTWDGTSWSQNPSLAPGEGAAIVNHSGTDFTVTFVGLVREGTFTHTFSSGQNLVSSFFPRSGAIISDFGYTPATVADDIFFVYDDPDLVNPWAEYYTGDSQSPAGWYDNNFEPINEPVIQVGDSFIVTPSEGDVWTESYYSDCPSFAPAWTVINVQFPGSSGQATKAGPAAVGVAGDYWNRGDVLDGEEPLVDGGYDEFQCSDNSHTLTSIALRLGSEGDPPESFPCGAGSASYAAATDPLMQGVDIETSGSATYILIFGLDSHATYDLYIYGVAQNSVLRWNAQFELTSQYPDVTTSSSNPLSTSSDTSWDINTWQEGAQYVVFRNVSFSSPNTGSIRMLKIRITSPIHAFSVINGLQLIRTN